MASSPTKQGEIMAMGIPLVCNFGVGDTDEIVTNYEAGSVINVFDDNQYLIAIENQKLVNKTKMISGAKEVYSLEQGVQKYLFVYKQVYEK